jgi:hypothetical protein
MRARVAAISGSSRGIWKRGSGQALIVSDHCPCRLGQLKGAAFYPCLRMVLFYLDSYI